MLAGLAAACGDTGPRPVQLQLITRGSCSPSAYDLSCVRSLRVQMFSEERSYRAQCLTLSPAFESWGDLVSSRDLLFVLEGVRARANVRIEIRGYHNRIENDPCESLNDESLMFWGTSQLVDLSQPDTDNVVVHVDCRPKCDCRLIDNGACTAALVRGVCAPRLLLTCRDRACTTGCFDGLLDCDSGTCVPSGGGMCFDCAASSECDSNMCIHHTYQVGNYDIDEAFCAYEPLCPPPSGWAHACPEGLPCTQIDGVSFSLLP
jgi:hypothetical protein